MTPRPVASSRPWEPPMLSGFPVTTAGTEYPLCIEYVSIIQAMVWELVPMSGAGMSLSGPIRIDSSEVKRRVRFSSSAWLNFLGSTITPPLAPPKGRLKIAHFHVIHMASAFTSVRVTAG